MTILFTSNDVARLAGVSQATVSRAFKAGSSMSPATREKVIEAARKLNYVPNSFARSLTTRKSNIVAIVIGDLTNSFYTETLASFSRSLRALGKHLLVFGVAQGAGADGAVREILEYQVDGIILTAAETSMRTAELCLNRGIPVVTFNRYVPGAQVNSVRCDNVEGGRIITEALLAAGARSFVVIYGDSDTTTNQDRLEGFWKAIDGRGIGRSEIRMLRGGYSYDGGHEATVRAFSEGRRFDAVLCLNDMMALGSIDALKHRLGFDVPKDVMVAGFDDIVEAARAPYDLTTMRQPIDRMVEEALDLLGLGDAPARGRAAASTLPATLVVRGSIRSPVT